MISTTLPRAAVFDGQRLLADAVPLGMPQDVRVGPEFEVVLLPEEYARLAVDHLDRRRRDLVGAVFSHANRWGFFLPLGSGAPLWVAPAEYRHAGSHVVLPPAHWHCPRGHGAGWVRQPTDGRVFTAPLFLRFALDAISETVPITVTRETTVPARPPQVGLVPQVSTGESSPRA